VVAVVEGNAAYVLPPRSSSSLMGRWVGAPGLLLHVCSLLSMEEEKIMREGGSSWSLPRRRLQARKGE